MNAEHGKEGIQVLAREIHMLQRIRFMSYCKGLGHSIQCYNFTFPGYLLGM